MSSSPLEFQIIIITYNSASEIKNLLSDIQKYSPKALAQTIIIDNFSTDKTIQIVKKHFPQVKLIKNKTNLGYSKAANQAVSLIKSDFFFLINPDIRILEKSFWTKTLKLISADKNIAAVGPLQFTDPENQPELTWSFWNQKGFLFLLRHLLRLKTSPRPFPVPFLNCGCLLIRRSAFLKVGQLNEKYFLYGEEPDLFFKFKRYGYQSYLHPGVRIIHFREKSFALLPKPQKIKLKIIGFKNILDALTKGFLNLALKPKTE